MADGSSSQSGILKFLGGSTMSKSIGLRLRRIRADWGLSLREVEERSLYLANESGDLTYQISASWLARIEREEHQLTASKLVALAAIYNLNYEQILGQRTHLKEAMRTSRHLFEPNATVILDHSAQSEREISVLARGDEQNPVPEQTSILEQSNASLPGPYRLAILGRCDRSLDPMIKAGAILEVDPQKRAIMPRRAWSNEFDRPIYLLMSHEGYWSGWCELDRESRWLTLIPHPLSHARSQRWRINTEVEVVGRVIAAHMRLDSHVQA
ncbi:MAG TPA: helix-turn-helix transcriptional regulator [Terriglobales bacterium]|nr:helix-turn-helix transcriptional regulator [Terriglobales bacterium]